MDCIVLIFSPKFYFLLHLTFALSQPLYQKPCVYICDRLEEEETMTFSGCKLCFWSENRHPVIVSQIKEFLRICHSTWGIVSSQFCHVFLFHPTNTSSTELPSLSFLLPPRAILLKCRSDHFIPSFLFFKTFIPSMVSNRCQDNDHIPYMAYKVLCDLALISFAFSYLMPPVTLFFRHLK